MPTRVKAESRAVPVIFNVHLSSSYGSGYCPWYGRKSLPSPGSWYRSLGDQVPQSQEGTGGISALTASTVEPLLGLFQPFLKSLPHTFLAPTWHHPGPRPIEPHPYNSGLALPCHCPEVGKSLETGVRGFSLHLAFSLHTCEIGKLLGFLTVRSNLEVCSETHCTLSGVEHGMGEGESIG